MLLYYYSPFIPPLSSILFLYLWKHLGINIGPKFVLTAMHPNAWDAYKNSNDLRMVIDRVAEYKEKKKDGGGDGGEGPSKVVFLFFYIQLFFSYFYL